MCLFSVCIVARRLVFVCCFLRTLCNRKSNVQLCPLRAKQLWGIFQQSLFDYVFSPTCTFLNVAAARIPQPLLACACWHAHGPCQSHCFIPSILLVDHGRFLFADLIFDTFLQLYSLCLLVLTSDLFCLSLVGLSLCRSVYLSMSVCYTLCSRSTYLSWLSFCPTWKRSLFIEMLQDASHVKNLHDSTRLQLWQLKGFVFSLFSHFQAFSDFLALIVSVRLLGLHPWSRGSSSRILRSARSTKGIFRRKWILLNQQQFWAWCFLRAWESRAAGMFWTWDGLKPQCFHEMANSAMYSF